MKPRKTFLCLLFALITASLACSLPMLQGSGSSGEGLPDGLTENYSPSLDYTPINPFNYSADQMAVINSYGNPTRFTIIFTETVRQETWNYDTRGYTVIFRNGVKLAEEIGTPLYREGMYTTTLGPNQFYRGMGIDEVVLSTGRDDINLVTLEGLDEESRLMHLPGLSVGLVDGKVNFVETIPAMTETLLMPEDFAAAPQPAPSSPAAQLTDVQAAIGSFAYSIIIYKALAVSDCGSYTTEFYLDGDTLMMVEDGSPSQLTLISENRYSASKEGMSITLKFTPTGYVYWGEDNGVLYEIYAMRELSDDIQIISNSDLSPDELYNQGTHTYQVDFCEAGAVFDPHQITLTNTFSNNSVEMVDAGIPDIDIKIGTNFYMDAEKENMTIIITDIGFVWRFDNDPNDVFAIFTLQ